MRLIDADALKKAITDATYNFEQIPIRVDKVQEIIDNAPTVEFPERITIKCDTEEDRQELLSALRNARVNAIVEEERPQGKWLHPYTTDIACECSICHVQMPITYYFHFCPNCGADMRKETDNED